MQELSKSLNDVANDTDGNALLPEEHLRKAAKKWASYVIDNNNGKALTKGLEISRCIADYMNEITDRNFREED